jgi:hypothetical protein
MGFGAEVLKAENCKLAAGEQKVAKQAFLKAHFTSSKASRHPASSLSFIPASAPLTLQCTGRRAPRLLRLRPDVRGV